MNTNHFFRTTMATSYTARKFFKKVVHDSYLQLQQWDPEVALEAEAWRLYTIKIQYRGQSYQVAFTKSEIDILQQESPYALDQAIWLHLIQQGLVIQPFEGNYLSKVLTSSIQRKIS